ncbi:MAG TPA: hypothetical protein QGI72_00590 [Poseidonia sp.]|nr:hypothetical protein [Poseidonia sp.]
MAHDPRAPKLAAISILLAVSSCIIAYLNAWKGFVGNNKSWGLAEFVLLIVAAVLVGLAKWANSEHEIPEFNPKPSSKMKVFEDFGDVQTPVASNYPTYQTTDAASSGTINQTTATILTSILGDGNQADEKEIRSAITTLSSGEFGARAQQEAKATEFAKEDNHQKSANPTSEETGAALKRVIVQPVPLPGRESDPLENPNTIPGFEPDRVFVTQGAEHIPLPDLPMDEPAEVKQAIKTSPIQPTEVIFDLPELPDEMSLEGETKAPLFVLPDLSDLFDDHPKPSAQEMFLTPELPDLDDLF